jgi:hypothetical protein
MAESGVGPIVISVLLDHSTAIQVTAHAHTRPVMLLTQIIEVAEATESTTLNVENAKCRPGSSDHLHSYLRAKLGKCLASKAASISVRSLV